MGKLPRAPRAGSAPRAPRPRTGSLPLPVGLAALTSFFVWGAAVTALWASLALFKPCTNAGQAMSKWLSVASGSRGRCQGGGGRQQVTNLSCRERCLQSDLNK